MKKKLEEVRLWQLPEEWNIKESKNSKQTNRERMPLSLMNRNSNRPSKES